MKNAFTTVKNKIVSKYLEEDFTEDQNSKSTNINVLLNRVKVNNKKENIKKIYFSAAVSTGLLLFGILVF